MTNALKKRVDDHKNGTSKWTSRYHFDRLVYYEIFNLVLEAIDREKQIKGLTRAKKIALIKRKNPRWEDLTPSS